MKQQLQQDDLDLILLGAMLRVHSQVGMRTLDNMVQRQREQIARTYPQQTRQEGYIV